MTAAHSRISPSSASIWGGERGCRAYPAMSAQYPRPSGEAANEGSAAHELAALWLTGGRIPALGEEVGDTGYTVTEEMKEAVDLYLFTVSGVLNRHRAPVSDLHVEDRVAIPSIHPDCFGTVDAWYYSRDRHALYIWDFKYGRGTVEVGKNLQLITYAAGIMDAIGVNGLDDQSLSVTFTIVQPRAFHRDGPVRYWTPWGDTLRPFVNQLESAAREALSPNPKTRAGAHCRYCSARHACPALSLASMAALDYVADASPMELGHHALGLEYAILREGKQAIEYRLAAIEERIIEKNGAEGWAVQQKRGREKWTIDAAEAISYASGFGVDISKPAVMTPKQSIKAGMPKDMVEIFTSRESTGLEVVPSDETKAARIFAEGDNNETE